MITKQIIRQNDTPSAWYTYLLILVVPFAGFSIPIGFSLKPYMILLLMLLCLYASSLLFDRLQPFEWMMLTFYFIYCFSGVFSLYATASLRIIVGVMLYVGFYFLMKAVLTRSTNKVIERGILWAGILFNSVSLILYVIGLSMIDPQVGERMASFGVLYDRSYPRLIGVLDDPNFYVFYNTLFFSFYLTNLNDRKAKVGFFVCILASVLTFSRGGLLVLLGILLLYFMFSRGQKRLQTITTMVVGGALMYVVALYVLKFNVYDMLLARIGDLTFDGGSDRIDLWQRAIGFMTNNPWLGLGPYNYAQYNEHYYGVELSVHNTYLDILTDAGVISLLFYLLFLFIVFYQLIQSNIHKSKPYFVYAFIGFVAQSMLLSVIINDMFFLYCAIVAVFLSRENVTRKERLHDTRTVFNG